MRASAVVPAILLASLFLLLPAAPIARAADDIITLKNGDKITGEIQQMTDGKLVLTTPYAKELTIDWAEVASIETAGERPVKLDTGEMATGKFVTRPDGVYFESAEWSSRDAFPLARVKSISEPPPPWPKWSGFMRVNFSLTRGNTDTTSLGAAGRVDRETDVDLFTIDAFTDYQQDDDGVSRQETQGGARYEYRFTERFFVDAFARLEHDKFEDLRLRAKAGADAGYKFIKTDEHLLQGALGLAYINENFYDSEDKDFVALHALEEYEWKIAEDHTLHEKLEVFPNLEKFSDCLVHFEVTYRNTLMKGLFVDLGIVDDYDSDPPDDTKKNDFKVIVGVGYSF